MKVDKQRVACFDAEVTQIKLNGLKASPNQIQIR